MALLAASVLVAGCLQAPDAVPVAPASVAERPGPEPSASAFGHPREDDPPEAPGPSGEPQGTPTTPPGKPTAAEAGEAAEDDRSEPAYPEAWTRPPKRPLPEPLAGLQHLASTPVPGGAGIATFGHYAFVGDYSPSHLYVVDIMDPAKPRVVAEMADVPVRDADVIAYPDGRLVLVTASGGSQFWITDVSEPTSPTLLGTVTTHDTNHNLAVVPGTPLVYNAPSGGSTTDIWDLTDPEAPIHVKDWDSGGNCHDVSFLVDVEAGLFRGYCAAMHEVQIWDIADPRSPTVVSRIPFPVAGVEGLGGVTPVSFAHLAIANQDGTVLIVGDETGGGLANGCDVYAEAAGSTLSGPLGNLWFYDISDEKDPVLKGRVSPSAPEGGLQCTAHFGRVIEDTDHLVMGFYQAGVLLIDFTDLENPRIVDAYDGGSVWDAWYYQGYVFTGDMSRGMDVLTFR